jgi:uncharacterized membrane protein (UPF0127 family)
LFFSDFNFCPQATRSNNRVGLRTEAKLKVAINGFGRIGRNFLRCWHGRKDSPLDVVVLNDSGGVRNVSPQPPTTTNTHKKKEMHKCSRS